MQRFDCATNLRISKTCRRSRHENDRPKAAPSWLDLMSYEGLRQQILRRDGWRCQSCGTMSNLEVHHREFRSHSGIRHRGELNHAVCGMPRPSASPLMPRTTETQYQPQHPFESRRLYNLRNGALNSTACVRLPPLQWEVEAQTESGADRYPTPISETRGQRTRGRIS